MIDHSIVRWAVWGHSYLVALYGSTLFMVLDHRGSSAARVSSKPVRRILCENFLRIVLTHGYVLTLAFMAAGYGGGNHTITDLAGIALTVCAFAISVAICWASYLLIEGPMINAAHRKFSYGDARDISSEASAAVVAARTSFRVPKLQSKHERREQLSHRLDRRGYCSCIIGCRRRQRTLVPVGAGQSNAGNMSAVFEQISLRDPRQRISMANFYVAAIRCAPAADFARKPLGSLGKCADSQRRLRQCRDCFGRQGGTSIRSGVRAAN